MSEAKHLHKFAKKLAFSKFVKSHEDDSQWICCSRTYVDLRDFHKHVAVVHHTDITAATENILAEGSDEARWKLLKRAPGPQSEGPEDGYDEEMVLPCDFQSEMSFQWLPTIALEDSDVKTCDAEAGQILLFYKYRNIKNTAHVRNWQEELCKRLHLTGKIRIATEGMNVTVGGTRHSTERYIKCVMAHPLFTDMTDWDFKKSDGDASAFPAGLKVGVFQEIVPMGISPNEISHGKAGEHLSVDDFHEVMEDYVKNVDEQGKKLFIDCRNFYESKIGQFSGALCPDIRKFSYWPEFVEKNKALFNDKEVYMYCTGGIRCERGSAYLREKGICDKVYQLHGGIHKYIEKYPDGHFRGKLFVFDDRYHIDANKDVIATCRYCSTPWDHYEPCSSKHCHQLVLSCPRCRGAGFTACCTSCQHMVKDGSSRTQEQCQCTNTRLRIPTEDPTEKH